MQYLSRQGAGRFKLTKAALSDLPILLPPKVEQQQIHDILLAWDVAIALTEQLLAAKQNRKWGLMQQLLTGKRRFKEFVGIEETHETLFGDLPKDWRFTSIAAIAQEVSTKNQDNHDLPVLSCTKHYGLVDSLEFFGRQIFSDDLSTYRVVKRHQFAYATNHIEEGSIGYQNLHDVALISPMYTVFETDQQQVDDRFLYALVKTERYRQIFAMNTSGSINRRGSLRWNVFAQIKIPLPSLEEQGRIAGVLACADIELELLERKIAALKRQKKGLMQQLLTGKVRVQTG